MKQNLPLVILGAILVLLGAAVMVLPGLTDGKVDLGAFSGPTSIVLIVIGIVSVFGSRFTHIKTPIVEAEDETADKKPEEPKP